MYFKKLIKQFLGHVIFFLLSRPRVAYPIKKFISRFPALVVRLHIIKSTITNEKPQIYRYANDYREPFLSRQVKLLRDNIRNRYPRLFQTLLNLAIVRKIYYALAHTPITMHHKPVEPTLKGDADPAMDLQESMIQASARWQLGKRIDV